MPLWSIYLQCNQQAEAMQLNLVLKKKQQTKLCLPLYVFMTPMHVEGSTLKVLPCWCALVLDLADCWTRHLSGGHWRRKSSLSAQWASGCPVQGLFGRVCDLYATKNRAYKLQINYNLSASAQLFIWQLKVITGSIWHITSLNSSLPQPLLRLTLKSFIQKLKSYILHQKVQKRQQVWAHLSQIQKEYFSSPVLSFRFWASCKINTVMLCKPLTEWKPDSERALRNYQSWRIYHVSSGHSLILTAWKSKLLPE